MRAVVATPGGRHQRHVLPTPHLDARELALRAGSRVQQHGAGRELDVAPCPGVLRISHVFAGAVPIPRGQGERRDGGLQQRVVLNASC